MKEEVKWKCPVCAADPNGCGTEKKSKTVCRGRNCMGFICECDTPDSFDDPDHGLTADNPCPNANCYCCGWGGTFPQPKFKLTGWAKKAWDAGWRPPKGWQP